MLSLQGTTMHRCHYKDMRRVCFWVGHTNKQNDKQLLGTDCGNTHRCASLFPWSIKRTLKNQTIDTTTRSKRAATWSHQPTAVKLCQTHDNIAVSFRFKGTPAEWQHQGTSTIPLTLHQDGKGIEPHENLFREFLWSCRIFTLRRRAIRLKTLSAS